MLNELETLSQNIGRLIEINQRQHAARLTLEAQLAELQTQCDNARAELEQMREERNALQAERDALSAKIDDAQVRLNAILEKLPRARAQAEPDNQLDLLDPSARADEDSHAERHGDHA
jgi:uncharacterized coiled-coil DUF342 family protein